MTDTMIPTTLTTEAPAASPMLTISVEAASQLRALVEKEENPDLALRVFVYPGGCSGMQYGMAMEDNIADDDILLLQHGVRLVVDESSVPYLLGSEIDYQDALMGGGFRIYNPNAVRGCSCGHSFDTGEDGAEARKCGSGGGGCGSH